MRHDRCTERCLRLASIVGVPVALFVLSLAIGCRGMGEGATAPVTNALSHSESAELPTTWGIETPGTAPACPPARGGGTVSPALSIYSVTFVVNGAERVVRAGETLPAWPGDGVQVLEATICTGSFAGPGGEACVDLQPEDGSKASITSQHLGTHTARVAPGFTSIRGPGDKWIISEDWRRVSVVLNHWPAQETEDLDCANGGCERDDRITIGLP
jgi:hypothetical protein